MLTAMLPLILLLTVTSEELFPRVAFVRSRNLLK